MQNSNRTDNRSPNDKLARYLHRIQQLVGNRGRTPSPISSRMARPLKPKSFDHYLKYELTLKILYRFFDKSNQSYMRYFFNMIRNSDINHNRVQKIYKFVPIEKTQCAHMVVDTGISIKMLTNILKSKLKQNIKSAFDSIKGRSLVQSKIATLNTARSIRSNVQSVQIYTTKNNSIGVVVLKMYINRIVNGFNKIKYVKIRDFQSQQQQLFKNQQQKVLKYAYNSLKINYFVAVVKVYMKNNKRYGFNNLLIYNCRKKSKQYEKSIYTFKVSLFGKLLYLKNKKKIINAIKQLKAFFISQAKLKKQQLQRQKQKEVLTKDNEFSLMDKVNDNQKNKTNTSVIQQATNWIGMRLISILYRRKMDTMRKIERYSWRRQRDLRNLCHIVEKVYLFNATIGFTTIRKYYQQSKFKQIQKNKSAQGIKWKTINNIVNLSKFFRAYLQQPFKKIKDYSENRLQKMQNTKLIVYFYYKSRGYQCFQRLKQLSQIKRKMYLQQQRQLIQQANLQKKQYLPKIISKIVIFRQIDAFIKLKNCKKKVNYQPNRARSRTQWFEDIQNFISQRNKFNKNLLQNYSKIEQIINNGKIYASQLVNQNQQSQGRTYSNNNNVSKNQASTSSTKPKKNNYTVHVK